MGTIRVLLAISVVLAHAGGLEMVGGRNAVQIFYMISGFLISYILVEKGKYPRALAFYKSRYLRLFPQYMLVVILTGVSFAAFPLPGSKELSQVYGSIPASATAFLAVANSTIFLQDWVMFTAVDSQELVFSKNFASADLPLYKGLLVPQAWTLGVELSFYALAPWILHRRATIFALLVASLCVRAYLVQLGLAFQDPWDYRFFPAELSFFLLGALSHQFLLPLYQRYSSRNLGWLSVVACAAGACLILSFSMFPAASLVKTAFIFLFFLLVMPLLFLFQNRYKWDVSVGELSYPIYINHILVIAYLRFFFEGSLSPAAFALLAIIFSIALAVVMSRWIATPFEIVRGRILEAALTGRDRASRRAAA